MEHGRQREVRAVDRFKPGRRTTKTSKEVLRTIDMMRALKTYSVNRHK